MCLSILRNDRVEVEGKQGVGVDCGPEGMIYGFVRWFQNCHGKFLDNIHIAKLK